MTHVFEFCVEPGELDDTREGDEYNPVFESDRDEAEDQVFNAANLTGLSTGDFLTFAAGIRQAA